MSKNRSEKNPSSGKNKPSVVPQIIRGLLTLVASLLIFLSLLSFTDGTLGTNWLGFLGYLSAWSLYYLFGLGSYLIIAYVGWIGWRLLWNKEVTTPRLKLVYFSILLFSFCTLMSLLDTVYPNFGSLLGRKVHFESFSFQSMHATNHIRHYLGGVPSYYLYYDIPKINLFTLVNRLGTLLIFGSLLIISTILLTKMPIGIFLHRLKEKLTQRAKERGASQGEKVSLFRRLRLSIPGWPLLEKEAVERPRKEPVNPFMELMSEDPPARPVMQRVTLHTQASKKNSDSSQASIAPQESFKTSSAQKREAAIEAQRVYNGDFANYQLPPLSLLTSPKSVDQPSLKKDLKRQAEILEETLMSFGIEAKVGEIYSGPTITSFEIHPAIGVKVQKIKALENDIALNMQAKSIRILAPIPGKAAVGIEIPSPKPQEVGFKDMLAAYQQSNRAFHIPVLLGKTVSGEDVASDLSKMPHCIIAGATGSGKSVCINTIIMSILMNARPDEIRLLLVDPKKVELSAYGKLPHMIAPVITEPHHACAALNWLVREMERRYEIFKQLGVRNIVSFNQRTIDQPLETSLEIEIPKKMYSLVAIIDELADLMMVSANDIETPITRIAQMARAVGIHLILATQRPSREVITGLIKANFPARVAFKVASRVNSQIILDDNGAEALLGNGDLLFLPPGSSNLLRAQGAYIRDEDINRVVKFICEQAPAKYLIDSFEGESTLSLGSATGGSTQADELYDQALETILETGNASTTFLQRKLKIGYARAASLMDQLEERGVVSAQEGSKPRRILVKRRHAETADDEFDSPV